MLVFLRRELLTTKKDSLLFIEIQCKSEEIKLSVFFAENNFCKAYIIFVKTECIMVSHAVEAELKVHFSLRKSSAR